VRRPTRSSTGPSRKAAPSGARTTGSRCPAKERRTSTLRGLLSGPVATAGCYCASDCGREWGRLHHLKGVETQARHYEGRQRPAAGESCFSARLAHVSQRWHTVVCTFAQGPCTVMTLLCTVTCVSSTPIPTFLLTPPPNRAH